MMSSPTLQRVDNLVVTFLVDNNIEWSYVHSFQLEQRTEGYCSKVYSIASRLQT